MADKGWIKTYRKIQECWIWLDKEPFDKRSAWIDLLLTANHADKKILFNGELITIKRGQILTSVRKLSLKWGWSVNKVYRFLELLISDEMVQKESDNNRTLLTIVNYSIFQDCEYTNEYTDEYSNGTPTNTPSDTVMNTPSEHKQECKELKNVKNDKEDIYKGQKFTPPTLEEVEEYCFERNNGIDAQSFIDFYQSKGWMVGKNKMKDWKAAVRTWEKSNTNRKPQQQVQSKRSSQLDDLLRKIREEE